MQKTKTNILCPNDWFLPVTSTETGHDPSLLHESLGKSSYSIKSVRTARNLGSGICKTGGHSGGLGIGHVATWLKSEYWIPHTCSHCPSPFWSIHSQPHLFDGLSNSLFIIDCSNTSNKHSTIGNNISLRFVLKLLFW